MAKETSTRIQWIKRALPITRTFMPYRSSPTNAAQMIPVFTLIALIEAWTKNRLSAPFLQTFNVYKFHRPFTSARWDQSAKVRFLFNSREAYSTLPRIERWCRYRSVRRRLFGGKITKKTTQHDVPTRVPKSPITIQSQLWRLGILFFSTKTTWASLEVLVGWGSININLPCWIVILLSLNFSKIVVHNKQIFSFSCHLIFILTHQRQQKWKRLP